MLYLKLIISHCFYNQNCTFLMDNESSYETESKNLSSSLTPFNAQQYSWQEESQTLHLHSGPISNIASAFRTVWAQPNSTDWSVLLPCSQHRMVCTYYECMIRSRCASICHPQAPASQQLSLQLGTLRDRQKCIHRVYCNFITLWYKTLRKRAVLEKWS